MARTYGIDEAAVFLRVSESTVQELAAAGELPGAKIGKAWVFLEDDLTDWLRKQIRAQQSERRAMAANDEELQASTQRNPSTLPPRKQRRRKSLPELPEPVGQVASS